MIELGAGREDRVRAHARPLDTPAASPPAATRPPPPPTTSPPPRQLRQLDGKADQVLGT